MVSICDFGIDIDAKLRCVDDVRCVAQFMDE